MAEMAQNQQGVSHHGSNTDPLQPAHDINISPASAAAPDEGGIAASGHRRTYAAVLIGTSGLLLEGLRRLLERTDFQVVASAPSVDRLPRIEPQLHKGVLLILDAGRDMEAALREVRAFTVLHETGRIAVVQGVLLWPDVVSFFQAGAHACFPESVAAETLLKSLELVMLGETLVPSTLLASMPSEGPPSPPVDNGGVHLSPQEERILGSLIEGQPNKVIARELGIADATVKIHVKSILRKLAVDNRTQAAAWAMHRGSFNGPPAQGSPPASIEANHDSSAHLVARSIPCEEAQESAPAVNAPLADPGHKACAKVAKPGIVNAPADRSFTQRWRLLPSERRMLEEQERRDEFLANMQRLRELREARDAMQRVGPRGEVQGPTTIRQ